MEGVYTGYKALAYYPAQDRIRSAHQDYEWYPNRDREVARCPGLADSFDLRCRGDAPCEQHNRCGFYVFYDLELAEEEASTMHGFMGYAARKLFVACVAFCGSGEYERVIHYRSFARASRMEVIAVFDHDGIGDTGSFGRKLGVPTLGREKIRDYAEWYRITTLEEEPEEGEVWITRE